MTDDWRKRIEDRLDLIERALSAHGWYGFGPYGGFSSVELRDAVTIPLESPRVQIISFGETGEGKNTWGDGLYIRKSSHDDRDD